MRYLYKSTKVIYDAHLKEYQVYYKNWFTWKYDSCYKYDENPAWTGNNANKDQAKERAINRAQAMLNTVEIWKQSNISYYV